MSTDITAAPPHVTDIPPSYFFAHVDLTGRRADKRAILDALSAALRFPTGPSPNWDALEDSLRDLSWLPAQGYVIVLEAGDADEDDLDTLREIFWAAAELFATDAIPYKLLLVRTG
jgi:hypothetical protein